MGDNKHSSRISNSVSTLQKIQRYWASQATHSQNISLEYLSRILNVVEEIFSKILAGRRKPLTLASWQKSTRAPSLVQSPLTVFS